MVPLTAFPPIREHSAFGSGLRPTGATDGSRSGNRNRSSRHRSFSLVAITTQCRRATVFARPTTFVRETWSGPPLSVVCVSADPIPPALCVRRSGAVSAGGSRNLPLLHVASTQPILEQRFAAATAATGRRFVVHRSPIAKRRFVLLEHKPFEFELKVWRRRPDLNRGWRFCRPLPYHLATAPLYVCEWSACPPPLARMARALARPTVALAKAGRRTLPGRGIVQRP